MSHISPSHLIRPKNEAPQNKAADGGPAQEAAGLYDETIIVVVVVDNDAHIVDAVVDAIRSQADDRQGPPSSSAVDYTDSAPFSRGSTRPRTLLVSPVCQHPT